MSLKMSYNHELNRNTLLAHNESNLKVEKFLRAKCKLESFKHRRVSKLQGANVKKEVKLVYRTIRRSLHMKNHETTMETVHININILFDFLAK